MATKQCFEINDKILNETIKLSGQSGILHDDFYSLILIDTYQVAQNIMEDTAKQINDEKFECLIPDIQAKARELAEYIYHILEYQFCMNTYEVIMNEDDTKLMTGEKK